ncbi:response regulator receiver protein [Methylobacterium sp. ME121]|nr:response regulator receiver protein [Methylobacterium sp. ME121]
MRQTTEPAPAAGPALSHLREGVSETQRLSGYTRPRAPQTRPAMIATPTFPDLSALVVDESLYIRRIVRDMLMRVGIKRVLEAPDGAEALGVLAESKPDISIIDWDLSILSGEEFIRLARTPTTSPCPTIPIILMLAQPRRNVVDRAVALGVNEIIAKPFSPKTLWSRLDEVINRPRPYSQVKSLLRPIPRRASAMKAVA